MDSHLLVDFNDIADSGLGLNPESITDVNSRLQLLLEPATKVFTSVQDFCDHLRTCALVKIIKQLARWTGKKAVA